MSLDQAAIQEIARMTRAQEVLLQLPGPGGAFAVLNPITGEVMWKGYTPASPASLTFHDSGDFVEHVVETLSALGKLTRGDSLTPGNIYFSRTGLQARFHPHHDHPHEVLSGAWGASLPLRKHPVFTELEALQKSKDFTQGQLINFLRAKLNGHVQETTIQTFRHLRLTMDGQGTQVKAQGHESVGKSIQQKVLTEVGGVIPDEITVEVPVFDLDELRAEVYPVKVLVDVEPDEDGKSSFTLTTVQNSLRQAEFDALDYLTQRVQGHLSDAEAHGVHLLHADLK